jgi:uncharacterized RDD family membrane protein YckC
MTEQIEQTLTKASRKRRIAAFFIDLFVVSFLMSGTVFLVLGPNFIDQNNFDKMSTIMTIVMIPGFILYLGKESIKGISFGKWIMGIMVRVETNVNSIPTFGKLFIRNLFLMIWPIEFFASVLDKNKRRIGDKLTNTVVLNNPSKAAKTNRIIALITIGLVLYGFTALFSGVILKSSEAYKTAIVSIENNNDIIKQTGEIVSYGAFPKGSINITNDYGQATLSISINGKVKKIEVTVLLEKLPNETWEVTDIKK